MDLQNFAQYLQPSSAIKMAENELCEAREASKIEDNAKKVVDHIHNACRMLTGLLKDYGTSMEALDQKKGY